MIYLKNQSGYALAIIILIIALVSVNSSIASVKHGDLPQRVRAALSNHFNNHFSVSSSKNGIVTIKGTVNRLYDKYRIFDIAEKVRGVKGIRDYVEVNTRQVPDDIIKANFLEDLKLESSILEPNRIKVAVSNGVIELRGTVSYPKERLLAEKNGEY